MPDEISRINASAVLRSSHAADIVAFGHTPLWRADWRRLFALTRRLNHLEAHVVILLVLLAQVGTSSPSLELPVSLDHIRRGLEHSGLNLETSVPETPTFRTTIRGDPWPPLWMDIYGTAGYIRTPRPPVHHEFLSMVTPEEFRAGTLYPTGVPVIPIIEAINHHLQPYLRKRREARARQQVYEDLLKHGFITKE